MIKQIGNPIFHIFIVILLTIVVWYGQDTFDLAADYTLRADFFASQGRMALAQDYYEQAAKHDPNNANRLYQLGLFYIEQDEYGDALVTLMQAQENGYPDNFSLQYNLGRAAYYQLEYPIAINHLEAALSQIDTSASDYSRDSHVSALTLLGWAYLNDVGCESATVFFDEALEISADASLARIGLRRCQP